MKHYDRDNGSSEETTSENGKYKYWRLATPIPLITMTLYFKKRYECQCGKQFKNTEAYELHYRKAGYEEKRYETIE